MEAIESLVELIGQLKEIDRSAAEIEQQYSKRRGRNPAALVTIRHNCAAATRTVAAQLTKEVSK